jgi:ABC-type nitrate/sulfonate/bicarbonate transport system permease component
MVLGALVGWPLGDWAVGLAVGVVVGIPVGVAMVVWRYRKAI